MELMLPLYVTELGAAYAGDALELLRRLEDESVDLVLTSPPFALQRRKEYGNPDEAEYADWLLPFAREVWRVLRETGSFVLELGGAYCRGRPVRSLYSYRTLLRLCDEQGWRLAEEFFWHNPARLPSPVEWVNRRKIRVKDAVTTIWWLSKSDYPKADVRRVLVPYSGSMEHVIRKGVPTPGRRPSGHVIRPGFAEDRGGAIPSNLLRIANTDSNSRYLQRCRLAGVRPHPARFPPQLPEFFVRFLTDPGDLVLDIFAGSNTTGWVAERLGRRWLAFELRRDYLAASAFRFVDTDDEGVLGGIYRRLVSGECLLSVPEMLVVKVVAGSLRAG